MIRPSLTRLRRFGHDASGLALLEFAFILPIVTMFFLVGGELANFITTRMRISQIALHLADNAARMGSGSMLQAKTLNESDINDLFVGAGYQAGGLKLYENGRVVISSVEALASANMYKIGWRRCRGDKAYTPKYTSASKLTDIPNGIGPTDQLVIAPLNGATMFVEVHYEYKPLFDARLVSSFVASGTAIDEIASMMVRDRRDLTKIYPVTGVTASNC